MNRGGNPTKKSFLPELRNIPERPSNPLAVRRRVSKLIDRGSKALPEQGCLEPLRKEKSGVMESKRHIELDHLPQSSCTVEDQLQAE
ncbi:hypothetical protein MHYP_G00171090 [Metynnis hypsauchen]